MATQTLEGSIKKEGALLIGDGELGMQMYDDTMQLAINKTLKTRSIVRTIVSGAGAVAMGYLAYKSNSLYCAFASGAITTIALIEGKDAVIAFKKYANTLEEAVSHGWNSREELKKINWRYL
jgi:hypothetical protein